MELTSQTLKDAQFRQAWKGYDTAEVDDFLDEVAIGVDLLSTRLRDALDRLAEAEGRAARAEVRPAARPQPDESVRRTLVLAQRAADLVVTEAKSVADRIVADAHQQAAALLADATGTANSTQQQAESRAAALIVEAETTAQRMTAQRAAELQRDLSGLIEDQARRRLDLERLSAQADAAYHQLRDQLEAQLHQLDGLRIDLTGHAALDLSDAVDASPSPSPSSLSPSLAPIAMMAVPTLLADPAPVDAQPTPAGRVITLGGQLVASTPISSPSLSTPVLHRPADAVPPAASDGSLAGPADHPSDGGGMFLDLVDAIGSARPAGEEAAATGSTAAGSEAPRVGAPAPVGSVFVTERPLSALALSLLNDAGSTSASNPPAASAPTNDPGNPAADPSR